MAKSGSERTTEWRKQLIDQGYKNKSFLMDPDTQARLKALKKRFGHSSEVETIALALKQLEAMPSNKPPPKRARRGEG